MQPVAGDVFRQNFAPYMGIKKGASARNTVGQAACAQTVSPRLLVAGCPSAHARLLSLLRGELGEAVGAGDLWLGCCSPSPSYDSALSPEDLWRLGGCP